MRLTPQFNDDDRGFDRPSRRKRSCKFKGAAPADPSHNENGNSLFPFAIIDPKAETLIAEGPSPGGSIQTDSDRSVRWFLWGGLKGGEQVGRNIEERTGDDEAGEGGPIGCHIAEPGVEILTGVSLEECVHDE